MMLIQFYKYVYSHCVYDVTDKEARGSLQPDYFMVIWRQQSYTKQDQKLQCHWPKSTVKTVILGIHQSFFFKSTPHDFNQEMQNIQTQWKPSKKHVRGHTQLKVFLCHKYLQAEIMDLLKCFIFYTMCLTIISIHDINVEHFTCLHVHTAAIHD